MFKYFTKCDLYIFPHRTTIVNWLLILFSFRFTLPSVIIVLFLYHFERVVVVDLFKCSLALSADGTCQNMKIKIPESSEFMNILNALHLFNGAFAIAAGLTVAAPPINDAFTRDFCFNSL